MNQRFNRYLFVCLFLALALVNTHKVALDDEEIPEAEGQPQEMFKQEVTQDQIEIPHVGADFVPKNPGFSYYYKKFTYEFYTIGFFVFTIIMFFKGKSSNDNLAQKWKRSCNEVISQNFAHFGTTKETSPVLEKLSYNEYHYYASGRQNCLYALFKIDLKKRQCMFSTLTLELLWPKRDQVVIEIPIKVPEYVLSDGSATTHIPLEFLICKKRDMKTVFNTFPYLKSCAGPTQCKNFKPETDQLIVIAESEEAANHIIDTQVGDILAKIGEKNLQELHISDQKPYNNYPMWLKATINIEDNEDRLKESARIVKLLFYIVDRVVTLRLNSSNKLKAEKTRKAVEKIKAKEKQEENEEEILRKKREKDQQFQEKLKSLPPDQQRKLEDKKREKESAKQRKRLSKIVKF